MQYNYSKLERTINICIHVSLLTHRGQLTVKLIKLLSLGVEISWVSFTSNFILDTGDDRLHPGVHIFHHLFMCLRKISSSVNLLPLSHIVELGASNCARLIVNKHFELSLDGHGTEAVQEVPVQPEGPVDRGSSTGFLTQNVWQNGAAI